MGSMVIRNIPDDVLERFEARARDAGKSAEQLAREAISEKAQPSREEIWAEIDAIRARSRLVDLETTLRLMEEALGRQADGTDRKGYRSRCRMRRRHLKSTRSAPRSGGWRSRNAPPPRSCSRSGIPRL